MSDGGAVAVSRIDYRLLRQSKQLLLHRAHQRTHTTGGEIGSAHGFLEQGIPADQEPSLWEIIADTACSMSGRCQNFDPDAIQIQFLAILQIHIRGNRYRASHIFRQVALRIQKKLFLRLPGINFHGVLSMLPGIGIRCRLQFCAATDMVKMSMGQKDCRRMQSVLSKCRLNFLSVIRGVEYQHFITVLSVYKVAVGLVDSQRHMSDTNIAHNNLHSAGVTKRY